MATALIQKVAWSPIHPEIFTAPLEDHGRIRTASVAVAEALKAINNGFRPTDHPSLELEV
jgi:hypothetical protein